MEVDIEEDNLPSKRSYKCGENLVDNLKISYHSSRVVLWNKYQVLLYEELNFDMVSKTFTPEFLIQDLLVTNNYFICLDCSGNLHVTSLKFKNTSQKQLKCAFKPREDFTKVFLLYKEDHVLLLKFKYDTFFVCLRKLSSDFKLIQKVILISNEDWPLETKDNCIIVKQSLDEEITEKLSKIFKNEYLKEHTDLIIISFNRLVVYGFMFNLKINDEINLVRLYSCPTEISNIEITQNYLLIALTIGTVLKLNLNDITACPEVIHLTTAIHKLILHNDKLIYTDGLTLWKTENVSSNTCFQELSVIQVADFIVIKNQIICTTFAKFIYVININTDNKSSKEESSHAKTLIDNSEIFKEILKEIEKNDCIVKRLTEEQNYLLALSLSNRQDVMNNIIKTKVFVYDNFEQISKTPLVFTEDISNYFGPEIYVFLIEFSVLNDQQSIFNVLASLTELCTIHITLLSNNNIIKTTSLKCSLNRTNYLIPSNITVTTNFCINIKLIANIPGALDETKKVLSVLYKNDINLNSEHFIRTTINNSNTFLKYPKEGIDQQIIMTVEKQYDLKLFKNNESGREWIFYLKLPRSYEDIFKNIDCDYIIEHKMSLIKEKMNVEKFIKSKSSIELSVGAHRVKIKIENDGFSHPLLKVIGENAIVALDIRKFFSNIIYKDGNYEAEELINWNFYSNTENLQKAVKNCMKSTSNTEEILKLSEQFEKNVIGSLPL